LGGRVIGRNCENFGGKEEKTLVGFFIKFLLTNFVKIWGGSQLLSPLTPGKVCTSMIGRALSVILIIIIALITLITPNPLITIIALMILNTT
jgi:hypothetical protein